MDKIRADNFKRIKQLEELIKQRNIMKENHLQHRMKKAGIQSDMFENVKLTEEVKTDYEKTVEPFKTLEKEFDEKRVDIADPVLKILLDDYGLLEANIDKKLPKSMLFEHSTFFLDKKLFARFYLGGKEIFPQPLRGLIFTPDKSPITLDRNFVELLRGADLKNYAVGDLIKYKAMLDRVGAAKSLRRYKQLENLLSTGVSSI